MLISASQRLIVLRPSDLIHLVHAEKEKEDSMGTIFTTIVDKLKAAAFLKYKESRKKYVEQLCAEVTKDSLIVVIEALVDNYLAH